MLARRLSKLLLICAGALVFLYLAVLTTLALAQRSFLYFPAGIVEAPVIKGAQVLHLDTADGERLLAWYVPPAAGKPLLLFFHGNGGNLATVEDTLADLARPGNGVLAVEYRGYPGSSGTPSEGGLIADAQAGYDKARALGIAPQRIIAFGESLGTGVAVALAAKNKIGGVVLISPHSSVADVAAAEYWMFPTRYLIWDSFHSDQRIAGIKAPLLIVHGTDDDAIPIRFARKLFDLASQPKRFIAIEEGGHRPTQEAMPQVLAWIRER
ncbi:alpha/beta hydrolase [Labrys miyagiensis]|uniref:Alpha/beta hydrolase n=1 Tax=Labrys miyagiensis TaxID=346912 RepID=A0ABQ6CBW3_9HYPH|nr:alpha/beta hydrolase [Labrys miyagiensis]GLS17861.1 alpha/beta hydrolase [Labrys miyagiensis]